MLVIYELSSDVAPMSNYLSGELHRAPKLGGLGFDLLFRFLLLSHAGGKTYAVKIVESWNCQENSHGRPVYIDENVAVGLLLALEYDIIPPFKRSIDDIRADDFDAFLLQNILHHSTSINASAEWISREKSRKLAKHDAI